MEGISLPSLRRFYFGFVRVSYDHYNLATLSDEKANKQSLILGLQIMWYQDLPIFGGEEGIVNSRR